MRVVRSSFLKIDVDLDELSCLVTDALGVAYRLTPLDVKCTYPVFRGNAVGKPPVFVKIGTADEWAHTAAILKALGDCGFFARLMTEKFIAYHGLAVFVTSWCEGRTVSLDDMNDAQTRSFADGCARLSGILQRVTASPSSDAMATHLPPERAWELLTAYARRHPVAVRPLRSLLALPAAVRTYGDRRLAVVHGDFHSKNYSFAGDRFAHVFDFDKLARDLACGDFVQALAYQFSELSLSRTTRRRLADVARRLVALVPWPRDELVIMANVWRLRFVAWRLAKHPDSVWTGLDAARRDRRLAELSAIISEAPRPS